MRFLLLITAVFASPAWGISPEDLEARLAEIAHHREARTSVVPPEIPAGDRRKAAEGKTTSGFLDGAIYGVGVLKVPIASLWAALTDETRQPQYTAVTHSEIVSGKACQPGRKILQYLEIGVPFVSDRWWIGLPRENDRLMRDSGGAVRELAFSSSVDASLVTSVSGKKYIGSAVPIGHSKGGWFLVALGPRETYVEYHAYSDPGSGIPTSVANSMAQRGVRNNFTAMAKFANQGSPSCPIR